MTVYSARGPIGRPLSVADIAAQPGGMEALYSRIHELRSGGLDFAANVIEREMSELDLAAARAHALPVVGSSVERAAG